MKKLILSILFLPLLALANPPIVWGPSQTAQMLTQAISFTPASSTDFIMSGNIDPSSVATSAPKGSLYSSTNGSLYIKQDAGLTTNWNVVSSGPALTVGTIDSQPASANGATAALGVLYMQSEDATHPGLVNNTTQTISGTKTFSSTISGNINGNAATVTTNANLTGPITSVGNATSIASQTGTGTKFVVDTSPTLVTPVIGAATGTSLSVSGQLTSTIATGTAPLVVSSTTQVANLNAATAGSATTATTATNATNVATTQVSNSASYFPLMVSSSTNGNQAADLGTGLTFNPNTNNMSTTTFTGALAGNATTATTATNATNIATTATNSTNASFFPTFVASSSSGNQGADTATGLTFNPSTNNLATTTFTGALSGNATTATTATTATNATNTAITDDTSTNATMYPTWVTTTSGNLPQKISSTKLTFNPSTSNLTATTFTGALTGTASGNTTYSANNHGVVLSGSGNAMTVIAPDASTTKVLTSGGSSADPSWAAVTASSFGTQTAGTFLAGPTSGSAATPTFRALQMPTIQTFTTNGTVVGYVFYVSGANATVGATYTNNGHTFTVSNTISSGTLLFTTGTSSPSTPTGTLTKSGGTGDATIAFTQSNSLATYTLPSGVLYIKVKMVGAGGGGGGSGTAAAGTGGTGTLSSFGLNLLQALGGVGGGTLGAGGGGGTASLGSGPIGTAIMGGTGSSGEEANIANINQMGGAGASSPFGGAGGGNGGGNVGYSAVANTGSGAGGAGCNTTSGNGSGSGGGAGGYIDAIITSPSATYVYSIGTGGAAGAAGTNGSNGGVGGTGYIEVTEYYQ